MESALISVIIPVYNVAEYLPRCLDSALRQTYRELEILVVDDGSTDSSGKICDEYADKDLRVKVIHKTNGGLSDARNAALDVMSGEYVFMLDGDDWIHSQTIEKLHRLLVTTGADVAVGGWKEVAENAPCDIDAPIPDASHFMCSGEEAVDHIFYQRHITHSAWGRLYKAELFHGIRYPKGMLYEDLAIAYPLYSRASTVAYTSAPYYYYRQRQSSILGTFKMQRTDVLHILDRLAQQVARESPQHLKAVNSRRLSAHFNILLLCPPGHEYDSVRDRCWRVITELRTSALADPNVRHKNKLGALASYAGRKVLLALFRKNL